MRTWTRTRIAAIERGDKAISAEDLLRLVAVLEIAADRPVDIAELFDSPDCIALSDIARIGARDFAEVLRGSPVSDRASLDLTLALPVQVEIDEAELRRLANRRLAIYAAGGHPVTIGQEKEVKKGFGEADERASRELNEPRSTFQSLCAVLWGQSLSAERDARLAAAGTDQGSPASVAARRGRVTRELLREARELLAIVDRNEGGDDGGEHREEA